MGAEFRDYTLFPSPNAGKALLFRAMEESHFETLMAWKELVLDGLEIYDIPGGYLCILHEPNVRTLAEKFKADIENSLNANHANSDEKACGIVPVSIILISVPKG